MLTRFSLVVIATFGVGGCASTQIDPSELPAQAFVDDGVDYYSVDLTDVPSSGANQWQFDENGEKIYTLNAATLNDVRVFYVGDFRYRQHEEHLSNNTINRNGAATQPTAFNRPNYGSKVRDPLLQRPRSHGLRYRTSGSSGTRLAAPSDDSASNESTGNAPQPASATPPRAPRTGPKPRVRGEPRSRTRSSRTPSPTNETDR